jgi:hypothetical protein
MPTEEALKEASIFPLPLLDNLAVMARTSRMVKR